MNSWRSALPLAGEPTADFRERLARQQAEAAERRQTALTEQSSPLNSAQARIQIWEQLHAIELPRDAGHRLVALIAANTGLSVAQVRAEQQRRATPVAAAPSSALAMPQAPGSQS
jgi:hypothetical protein